jgi:hypothetical protein
MYSLALIIFVVSEKKAFEHFPIGSNVNLCPAVAADRKSKMAATAGHKLTLDPMGKCSNAFFSETTNMIKAKLYMKSMSCGGGHLGFPIGNENSNLVKNLPMIIHGQFGFNCPSGFREEAF